MARAPAVDVNVAGDYDENDACADQSWRRLESAAVGV
jgi:hypothetical protein